MLLQIRIKPGRFALILASVAGILAGLSLIADYIVEVVYRDSDTVWLRLVDLFSVNLEQSIPTWFSTILLFVAAVILMLIALMKWQQQDAYRKHWLGLTFIFLYLSIDEGAVIHEVASDPLTQLFNTTGYLYFGWQILFVPLVLIFALAYIGFIMHLPPRSRLGFVGAGVVYVAGAVLIEGMSANELFIANDVYTLRYLATATVEELLEMLGIVLFIYALLDYVVRTNGQALFSNVDAQQIVDIDSITTRESTTNSDWFTQQIDRLRAYRYAQSILLFIASANAIIIQWLTLREATVIVHYPEFIIVSMVGLFFVGSILASLFAVRFRRLISSQTILVALILQLTLPLWFRLMTIAFDNLGMSPVGNIVAVGLVLFLTTGFYSLWLPLLDPTTGLRTFAIQMVGMVVGVALLFLFTRWGYYPVVVAYTVIILFVLLIRGTSTTWLMRIGLVVTVWLWFLPAINQWSTGIWLQHFRTVSVDTTVLFSDYSLRQKVDVLHDDSGNRYLFQNGINTFYGENSRWQNILMGRIPASIIQPENILVIGAGSMQMELMMAHYAQHVTTLEPDPMVASVSRDLFASYNLMGTLDNRSVVVSDVNPYLASDDTNYDLIAGNLPDIYDLQTSALNTTDFFELIRSRLTEEGVFVINLTQTLTPDHIMSRRLAASLLAVFDDILVVNTGETSYAFASQNLPFLTSDIQLALQAAGRIDFGIFEMNAVVALVAEAQPIASIADWLHLLTIKQ